MPIAQQIDAGGVPVKVWTRDLEPSARRQLENVSRLPIVHGHVAAMPDVHAGIGATVGSVIPTKGAIIPAAVGPNDRVERPATTAVPRPDAAHDVSRSAPTRC